MATPSDQLKILVADDDPKVCAILKDFLEGERYRVETAVDGEDALEKLGVFAPDCILLNAHMPYLSGVEALRMIKFRSPGTEIIVTAGIANPRMAEECLANGAFAYVKKPFDLPRLSAKICAAVEHGKEARNKKSAAETAQREDKKENVEGHRDKVIAQRANEELFLSLRTALDLADYTDHEFVEHGKDVAWLAKAVAEQLRFSRLRLIELAGLYHDVGKLCFPRRLRELRWEHLTTFERNVFRRFPLISQDIVESHSHLADIGIIVRHQCESMDGMGFPDGLKGDEIPLPSRILAVANHFAEKLGPKTTANFEIDLASWDTEELVAGLRQQGGYKFDPLVVEALAKAIDRCRSHPKEEKKLELDELKPGMVLSRGILTESGKIVFPHHTVLSPFRIALIVDLNQIDLIVTPVHVFA